MEVVTANSEQLLVEMLQRIRESPDDWLSVHFNILPVHKEMLNKEGMSQQTLAKIQTISFKIAQKLYKSGLDKFEGKIMVFEDSDVLAMILKTSAPDLESALKQLCAEFPKADANKLLSIEEMKDKLSQLILFSEEKMHSAEEYKMRKQALDSNGALLELIDPAYELAQELEKRRRGGQRPCVLVIEDDVMVRGLIASLLEPEYVVIQAKNGPSGITAYIENAPNIVFLDINMPGMDGHETLIKLKKTDPRAYVIMLSGASTSANVNASKSGGADGFIRKPFSKDKLLEFVIKSPSLQPEVIQQALGWHTFKNPFKPE